MTNNKDNYISRATYKNILILLSIVLSFNIHGEVDKASCSAQYQKDLLEAINSDKDNNKKLAEFSLSKTLQKLAYAHHMLQDEVGSAESIKGQMRQLFADNPKRAIIANDLESFKSKFETQKTINDPRAKYTEYYKDSYFSALTEYAKANPKISEDLKLSDFEVDTLKSLKFHEGEEGQQRDIWKTFVSDLAHNYYRRKFRNNEGQQVKIDKGFLSDKIKNYDKDFDLTIKDIIKKHQEKANLLSNECFALLKSIHKDSTAPCNIFDPFDLKDKDLTLNMDDIIDKLQEEGLASVELQNIRYKGATFEASCKATSYDPETGMAEVEMDMNFENIPYFENGDAWKVGLNGDQYTDIESNKHSSDFLETGLTSQSFSQKSIRYNVKLSQEDIDSDKSIQLDFKGPKDIKMFQPGAGSTRIGNENSFEQLCDYSKFKTPATPPSTPQTVIKLNIVKDEILNKYTVTATIEPKPNDYSLDDLIWKLADADITASDGSLIVEAIGTDQALTVSHKNESIKPAQGTIPKIALPAPSDIGIKIKAEAIGDDKVKLVATLSGVEQEKAKNVVWSCDPTECSSTSESYEIAKGDKEIKVTATYEDGGKVVSDTYRVTKLDKEKDKNKEKDEDKCVDDDLFDNVDSCAEKDEEERAPIEKTYMPPMQQPMVLPSAPSYISPGFN